MVAGAAAILDPDAEAHPARLMTLRRASGMLPIAEAFDDLVEPLCKVAVNAAVAQSKRLAQGKQILATKIIGVDPQSPRDHVDLRFRRKARLGSAKAAKRPRRNRVGAHRISARLARRSLALRPAHSRGHQVVSAIRRLQPFRYLHDCSDRFRRERIAGWALHPLIWGIGVKRKFSASRTAFLRKL